MSNENMIKKVKEETQQKLKYSSKMCNGKDGVIISAKQEKRARKIAEKIAKETKNLTYPQLLKEWEDAIFKAYMYEDKILDELKDAISLMKIRQKEKNTSIIAEKIRSNNFQGYSTVLLVKLLFTVAYFCKDGPNLYREIFGNKVPASIEKDLSAFEHNHKVYQYEIDNGMSK